MVNLTLTVGSERLVIARLNPDEELPNFDGIGGFLSITKTPEEISIVIPEKKVVTFPEWKCEKGWRYLKVEGQLDFDLVGILTSILNPLAKNEISIFVISTFDTDYILVKEKNLKRSIEVLKKKGFNILDS